ncbi:hypothetical protein AAHE18_14G023100 [Arachis hypogaea]
MHVLILKWFFLIIFLGTLTIFVLRSKFHRLGIVLQNTKTQYHDHVVNMSCTQILDHFNYKPESYITFQQRYVIDFKNWNGSKWGTSIFFLWFDDKASLEDGIDVAGFLKGNTLCFGALLLYIEVEKKSTETKNVVFEKSSCDSPLNHIKMGAFDLEPSQFLKFITYFY